MTKMSRLSVDIPADTHKYIKAMAALKEMSVKEFILESVQAESKKPKKLKARTAKAIADAKSGRNTKSFDSVEALLRELRS